MSDFTVSEWDFANETIQSRNHAVWIDGHPTVYYIRLLTASGKIAYKTEREAELHVVHRPEGPIDYDALKKNRQEVVKTLADAGIECTENKWCVDVHPDDLESALVALGFDAPSVDAIMEHAAIADDKKFMFDANRLRELLVRDLGTDPDNLRQAMVELGRDPAMIDAVVAMQEGLNQAAEDLGGAPGLNAA